MMDGCSSMAQWTNMYLHQQHGLETSRSISLTLDPIQEQNDQEMIVANSQALMGTGSWSQGYATSDQLCSSLPLMFQSQCFDTSNNNGIASTSANSIDQQSFECLLSGTNSNNDTSIEDDGISMIFSDCHNFFKFSSNPTNNDINNDNDSNKSNKNRPIYPTDVTCEKNTSKKRSNIEPTQSDHQNHPSFTIKSTSSPNLRGKKRQKTTTTTKNNGDKFVPSRIIGSSNISFQQGSSLGSSIDEPDAEAIQQMKEMIYRAAIFRPVNFGVDMLETPKRKNVRISNDPQTVAARQRRERISEKLRVLQKLVPGGTKMDTASMLDEAANYLKFLRNQIKALESLGNNKIDNYYYSPNPSTNLVFPPINLHFSPMSIPMQTIGVSPISLQNPNHVVHVPKS